MADILFSDDFDSVEDEQVEVSPLDEESEDDAIDPLLFVQKYISSDDTVKRQRVARSLADAMRWTEGDADVEVVLIAAEQLAVDLEPRVRIDVIEELPDITAFCLEDSRSIDTVLNRLLPVLAKYLCDPHDQVRKSGHSTLFSMLEHQLIGSVDVEHFMVPVLSKMAAADSCMSQLEAARVVMRVAPMLEPEVIGRVFIPLIGILSSAQFFEVRKTCASGFGPLSQAVPGDDNESTVLPLFRSLCSDSVWGVRKGCTETFVDVSLACTLEQRRGVLCQLFLSFLQDSSKWVQKAAYQVLGPFIATFHDPHLAYSDTDREESEVLAATSPIPLVDNESPSKPTLVVGNAEEDSGSDVSLPAMKNVTSDEEKKLNSDIEDVGLFLRSDYAELDDSPNETSNQNERRELPASDIHEVANSEGFSSFVYWKSPLPDISAELGQIEEQPPPAPPRQEGEYLSEESLGDCERIGGLFDDEEDIHQSVDGNVVTCVQSRGSGDDWKQLVCSESEVGLEDSSFYRVSEHSWDHSSAGEMESLVLKQDVVPEELLEHYISMIEPCQAQLIDPDLPLHCAYSFPGVALTLGKEHWSCIKPVYGILCSDMQWKVRRTLSYSVHEVARILGKENTEDDLVSVFDDFLKDLDEVRIGVLSHFSEFVELVSPERRKRYLNYLANFQQMDNKNNWRFRQALAEQLGHLCVLCEPVDIHTHIVPIAINLATDRVADVRSLAVDVLGKSLLHLRKAVDMSMADQLAEDVRNRFGLSNRWLERQTFARFCQSVLVANYVSPSEFAENFLDPLLDLVSDSVANVRLVVSRTIAENLLSIDSFKPKESDLSPSALSVSLAVNQLLRDSDRDVRNFLAQVPDLAGFVTQDTPSQNARSENEEESGDEFVDASMEIEDSSTSEDVHACDSSGVDSGERPVSGYSSSGSDGVLGGDES